MNNINLVGRLVNEPLIDFTTKGTARAKFRIADNVYNYQTKKREGQFFNILAFGKNAEIIGNTLTKGKNIVINGVLQAKPYESKDGEKKTYYQILLKNFEYAEKK